MATTEKEPGVDRKLGSDHGSHYSETTTDSRTDILSGVCRMLPILKWLPEYNVKENLLDDIVGGLTVGVMHIPQGRIIFLFIIVFFVSYNTFFSTLSKSSK